MNTKNTFRQIAQQKKWLILFSYHFFINCKGTFYKVIHPKTHQKKKRIKEK